MQIKCYSIHDTKSLTYSNPFYAPTHGAAIRIVTDAVQDLNTQLGRHPADFVLYCVGYFDDQYGHLVPVEIKEHVIDLVALVKHDNPELFSYKTRYSDAPTQPTSSSSNGKA